MSRPTLAVTMGDPAGVGPEIILKACRQLRSRVQNGEFRLLIIGHRSDLALELHKVAFIVWSACFAVHFLWYLPRAYRNLATSLRASRFERTPGWGVRGVLLGAALGGGTALALALLSSIQTWHGGRG